MQRSLRASRRGFVAALAGSLLAALALVVVDLPAAFAQTAPTDTVQWTVTPATAAGPDDRVSLRHEIAPGQSAQDFIAVTNQSTTPQEFQVVSGDGRIGADGAFDISSDAPTDAGSWIITGGLDGKKLALGAGETRVLPVTISVPAGAVPGDHPAGVAVARVQAADGVSVTHRIGVRVHLRVTGEVKPSLEITSFDATFKPGIIPFAPGQLEVTYYLTNNGNVRLGATSSLVVSGPFGIGKQEVKPTEAREVLPGDHTLQRITIEASPLVLLTGELQVAPQALGDDQVTTPALIKQPISAVAMSWNGALIVVLVIALIVLLVIRNKQKKAMKNADL